MKDEVKINSMVYSMKDQPQKMMLVVKLGSDWADCQTLGKNKIVKRYMLADLIVSNSRPMGVIF